MAGKRHTKSKKRRKAPQWVVKRGRLTLTSAMSQAEIQSALAEQRAIAAEALGNLPIPATLERAWRRIARPEGSDE